MGENILAVFLSYFIGNFSTSFFVGKLFAKIDIREYGSGNAGSTNVLRTLGKKAAIATLLGDLLKGVLAVYIGNRFGGQNLALLCGVAVVIGHNWPVILGFKGGKGIATTIGVALSIKFLMALICISVGIIILWKYKYVSLAAIVAISIFPFTIYVYGLNYFLFGLILAILAIYKHRENIKRLLAGNERKIGQKIIVK